MAFVYEKLTEQDKEFFASFKLPNPLSYSRLAHTPSEWTSDRDRGIFFVDVGGQGFWNSEEYPPTFYYLIWGGKLIRMQAYYKVILNKKEGRKYIYRVHRILAPSVLKDKSELIIETIKEALTEYSRGMCTIFNSIEFAEMGKPFFMEGDVRYQ